MPQTGSRVTLKHVATRAGVSFSAVSKILRRDPRFTFQEETRRRVLDAARELGYVPNPMAQALRSGKTRLIGIFAGGLGDDPVRQAKLLAVSRRLVKAGYRVILESHEFRPDLNVLALLRDLMGMRCCGLLTAFGPGSSGAELPPDVHAELLQIHRSGVPVVGMESETPGEWVVVDRRAAFHRGTRYLLDLGHRRIALVGTFPSKARGNPREQGYTQALHEAGVTPDPTLIVPVLGHAAPTPYHWGSVAITELLQRRPDVTAVAATSDRIAMGVVQGALQAGRRIPADLSVIGFDGLARAEFAAVPITTLAQPIEQMAEIAVRLLLEALERSPEEPEPAEPRRIVLEPRLVERASCAPPHA
jgi:LacI family transcriptional regulator